MNIMKHSRKVVSLLKQTIFRRHIEVVEKGGLCKHYYLFDIDMIVRTESEIFLSKPSSTLYELSEEINYLMLNGNEEASESEEESEDV